MLETGAATPAWNMAFDAALLRAASAPTLRLYRWSPPGLSLGWFQDAATFASVAGPHELVRRPTGGGAIYHDDEITFALTIDAEHLPGDIGSSYQRLHGAVARALAGVGVATRLLPAGAGAPRARPSQPWCFAVPGAFDLVLAASGKKIVGSAQRRIRAPRPRILHHGALVLVAPRPTPFCGAVADCVDPRCAERPLLDGLAAELALALGLVVERATPEPEEAAAARANEATFAALMP